MVADIIPPTKTSGGRPPYFPPLPGTTFAQEPDDHRQDMLVHIRDSVERLVRETRDLDADVVSVFIGLIDQRRAWIVGEMQTEKLLEAPPQAPLGIEEDPYDLSSLTFEFECPRLKAYSYMLELLDGAKDRLERQMADQKHDA